MYAYNQISIYIFRCKLIICVWVYFISLLFPGTFSHIFPKLFSKNLVLNICVTFMVVVLVTQLSDSVIPWTVALQALLSMGFSRQEN